VKILIAIDGSGCSKAAIKEVAERPWPPATRVKVLCVIEPVVFPVPEAVIMPESCYDVMKAAAETEVDSALLSLRKKSPNLKIESETRFGEAEEVILDEAENWGADLIVLGSHGRGTTGRLVLGSVSQAVAIHAKCSVEIVRQ
jgi:nucleotide-binding universal stress UspA family protein